MALNFPAKIYQILENESSDIIRWHSNGTAFRIVDHGRFEREIIPKYFRHNQISSVQRQLNLYGFKCISRGEDKGAFFHPKFRRGDWEVVKRITRYAPLKKLETSSVDRKIEGVVKLAESQVIDTAVPYEVVAPSPAPMIESHFHQAVPQQPQPQQPQPQPQQSQLQSQLQSQQPQQPPPPQPQPQSQQSQQQQQPMPVYGSYNPPPYMHFDAFFHHQDLACHNWHAWPMMHRSPMYPPMMPIKPDPADFGCGGAEEKKEDPLDRDNDSDVSSTTSETTVPQNSGAMPSEVEPQPFVRVVDNVVTVNPYYDLDDEFGLFPQEELRDDGLALPAMRMAAQASACMPLAVLPFSTSLASLGEAEQKGSSTAPSACAASTASIASSRFSEMGVNTELTMVQMNQLYQWCFNAVP